MNKIPILMDCDPGHDDAIAIILALSSEKLNVLGITTACGNQTIEKTTKNAQGICEFLGRRDVPVAKGRRAPLLTPVYTAGIAHGESGLDGPQLPEPAVPLQEESAVVFMARKLEESRKPVTLVPTGPLTNIAVLLLCYPHLIQKIDRIVLMGGSVVSGCSGRGASEFNIMVDPYAADIVFTSGIPIVMMGLDVTNFTTIGFDEKEKFRRAGRVGALVADLADYFGRGFEMVGWCGVPVHDACTIAYLIDPTLFTMREMNVRIDLSGEFTMGSTVGDSYGVEGHEANALVGLASDRERFVELLLGACAGYEKGEGCNE
ncbi:nucleoside hydrolase [bacterium C-53]|nr:nucleoside hydrolase [Lachnospiraceae bacterium]NBI03802.1 nucleoside hydrolase [Lachnospiraceae bacterium]RKJ09149.1 nucleoside hydrolase [bacterium C-53]